MGRVKISPFEAGAKLLARDRYSSIKHKSFLFDFMEYMSEDGLNLDTKEAQMIYEYFDVAIQRTLENGELELFEQDEPDDGTDDKPQEDLAPYTPGAGQPPIESGIANCSGSGSKVMQGYVSGSNVEPEDMEWLAELVQKGESSLVSIEPECIIRSDATKRMLYIDTIMKCYDLKQDEAEAVYASLRKEEGRPPLSKCAFEALNHIEKVSDLINNL